MCRPRDAGPGGSGRARRGPPRRAGRLLGRLRQEHAVGPAEQRSVSANVRVSADGVEFDSVDELAKTHCDTCDGVAYLPGWPTEPCPDDRILFWTTRTGVISASHSIGLGLAPSNWPPMLNERRVHARGAGRSPCRFDSNVSARPNCTPASGTRDDYIEADSTGIRADDRDDTCDIGKLDGQLLNSSTPSPDTAARVDSVGAPLPIGLAMSPNGESASGGVSRGRSGCGSPRPWSGR